MHRLICRRYRLTSLTGKAVILQLVEVMFKNILIKLQELSINTDLQWFWPVMLAASVALTLTMERRCNTQISSFYFSAIIAADYRRLARFIYATRNMSQDSVSKTVHWTVKVFLFVFHIFMHYLFMQKLRADWNQRMLVIFLCRISCLPVYYPKT
jgi:hypothetical protein